MQGRAKLLSIKIIAKKQKKCFTPEKSLVLDYEFLKRVVFTHKFALIYAISLEHLNTLYLDFA